MDPFVGQHIAYVVGGAGGVGYPMQISSQSFELASFYE